VSCGGGVSLRGIAGEGRPTEGTKVYNTTLRIPGCRSAAYRELRRLIEQHPEPDRAIKQAIDSLRP